MVGVACGGAKLNVGINGCKTGATTDNGASVGRIVGRDATPPSPPPVGVANTAGAAVGVTNGAGPCGFGGTAGCAVKIDGTGAVVGVICGTSGQPDRIQHCFGQ